MKVFPLHRNGGGYYSLPLAHLHYPSGCHLLVLLSLLHQYLFFLPHLSMPIPIFSLLKETLDI